MEQVVGSEGPVFGVDSLHLGLQPLDGGLGGAGDPLHHWGHRVPTSHSIHTALRGCRHSVALVVRLGSCSGSVGANASTSHACHSDTSNTWLR